MEKLYDSIGSTYTFTRQADTEITQEISRLVCNEKGSRFLDVACGTGNYTSSIATLGGEWYGIDISEVMLKQAFDKNANIKWTLGDVASLPYSDEYFNGAVCSLAIHHFTDLTSAFKEIYRVIDKGNFIIFTAFPDQMQSYWLCNYFPEMMRRSIHNMPDQKTLVTSLQSVGFEVKNIAPFFVTNELQDMFLYSGKERPEIYFDPNVRSNISSFASLCDIEELGNGLSSLSVDLSTGKFLSIKQKYSSISGDYAYVVARKN